LGAAGHSAKGGEWPAKKADLGFGSIYPDTDADDFGESLYDPKRSNSGRRLLLEQRKVYAFIIANTSLTKREIADMTDEEIGDVLKEFEKKD
jgi:hypothetical protein